MKKIVILIVFLFVSLPVSKIHADSSPSVTQCAPIVTDSGQFAELAELVRQ